MIKILLDRTTNNYKYRSDWDNLAIGEYFIKQRDKELIFCKKVNNYQTENIGYITDLKEFLYAYEDKIIK